MKKVKSVNDAERRGMQRVVDALCRHIGITRGISAADLAIKSQLSVRNVRMAVTVLREEGMAICAHPSTGYFIAETAEDVEQTCKFLHDRAMHSLHLEAQLRRMPLAELVGQIRFNQ